MNAWAILFDEPVPYPRGLRLQEALVCARQSGAIPDTVLFLQHAPVVTLGARARESHLLLSRAQLAARGIAVAATSRGGDVTYHGPGQLVVYPILKLGTREADVRGYLRNLEESAIRTLADFGVSGFRRAGLPGVWTAAGKVAALGVRFRRWITLHGVSLNVDLDLTPFRYIVPCGLAGEAVTSLRACLGARCPALEQVRERMLAHVGAVTARTLDVHAAADPHSPCAPWLRVS